MSDRFSIGLVEGARYAVIADALVNKMRRFPCSKVADLTTGNGEATIAATFPIEIDTPLIFKRQGVLNYKRRPPEPDFPITASRRHASSKPDVIPL